MQPGCFQCFESVWMGLRSSKSRRNRDYQKNDGPVGVVNAHQVIEFESVHRDAVTCLSAYSPGFCVSGSADRTVALFNLRSGVVCQRWVGHEKEVTKVVPSHSEELVYSASRDKTIRVWRIGDASHEAVAAYEGHSLVVTSIDLNMAQTLLFSGSRDNTVKLWDVATGTCVLENEISRNLVSCVKWVPDTSLVAQTGEDKTLRVWDTRNMDVAITFPRKNYIQTCCDCSPDGLYVLTSNNGFNRNGCEATLWDLRQQKELHQYVGHTQTTSACMFLPYDSMVSSKPLVVTASHDSSVRIWNRDTQECVLVEEFPGSGPLTDLAHFDGESFCISSFHVGIYHMSLKSTSNGLHLKRMTHF
ncbi:WD repeat-containing protein 31-like [Nematostella vectensis]|uniref:WD repeat-containing protein 31-like n=1 Tax=Nematostella vectensis TaxID=45351 RepID=UPI0020773A26|nr:WD repeat-containing protein 31-like [Nematostella vectensis]